MEIKDFFVDKAIPKFATPYKGTRQTLEEFKVSKDTNVPIVLDNCDEIFEGKGMVFSICKNAGEFGVMDFKNGIFYHKNYSKNSKRFRTKRKYVLKRVLFNLAIPTTAKKYDCELCSLEEYRKSGRAAGKVASVEGATEAFKDGNKIYTVNYDTYELGLLNVGKAFVIKKLSEETGRVTVNYSFDFDEDNEKIEEQRKKEEAIKMANKEEAKLEEILGGDTALNDIIDEIENETSNNDKVQELNEFSGDQKDGNAEEKEEPKEKTPEQLAKEAERERKKAWQEEFEGKIAADTEDIQLVDDGRFVRYVRALGRFMGFVTNYDEQIKITVPKTVKKDSVTGQKILSVNATAETKDKFARGESIPITEFEYTTAIKMKHATPGKILGGVISMPTEALQIFPSDLVDTSKKLEFDNTNTDTRNVLYTKDELQDMILIYYGTEIQESEETYGERAGTLKVDIKSVSKTDPASKKPLMYKRKVFKTSVKGRSLIVPNAYLPLKVYETIPYSDKLNDKQIQALNISSFKTMYDPEKKVNKYETTMTADFAGMVDIDAEGNITSKYFTTDASKRAPLKITAYHDKEKVLSTPEFTVKELKETTKSKRYVPITYSILDKRFDSDTSYANKCSINMDKFKPFMKACGDALTRESLSTLGRTSSQEKGISSELAQKFALKEVLGGAGSVSLESADKDTLDINNFLGKFEAVRQ